MDEKRVDEIGRSDDVLTDHSTYTGGLSIPTRSRTLLNPNPTMIIARYGRRVARCRIECFVAEIVVDAVHGGIDGIGVTGTEEGGG